MQLENDFVISHSGSVGGPSNLDKMIHIPQSKFEKEDMQNQDIMEFDPNKNLGRTKTFSDDGEENNSMMPKRIENDKLNLHNYF